MSSVNGNGRRVVVTGVGLLSPLGNDVETSWRALLAGESRERRRGGTVRPTRRARRRAGEMTKWVADLRARRVPNFVIEMTGGLDTKKRIVARYGPNARFEKGKPPPPRLDASVAAHPASAARVVKAAPPRVRKAVAE